VLVPERAWEFESPHPHQFKNVFGFEKFSVLKHLDIVVKIK
jgi:hypothetical protein